MIKPGDLIKYRHDWRHVNHIYNEDGIAVSWEVEAPRQDNEEWSQPCLVLRSWAEMWIVLDGATEIVVNPRRGITAVEVINGS
jgi:hypothetical protein